MHWNWHAIHRPALTLIQPAQSSLKTSLLTRSLSATSNASEEFLWRRVVWFAQPFALHCPQFNCNFTQEEIPPQNEVNLFVRLFAYIFVRLYNGNIVKYKIYWNSIKRIFIYKIVISTVAGKQCESPRRVWTTIARSSEEWQLRRSSIALLENMYIRGSVDKEVA